MNKLKVKIANDIWEKINIGNNFLLSCHKNADPDSLGGALAMAEIIKNLGKKATVIMGENVFDYELNLLPGCEKIEPVSLDQIKIDDFDFFLIQDSAAWNMVSTVVLEEMIPEDKKIVIDHHFNQIKAKIRLISEEYGSNCEQIFDLIQHWKLKITSSIATNLYIGMYTDTGAFCFPKTDKNTLKMAYRLCEINPGIPDFVLKFISSIEKDGFLLQTAILKNWQELLGGKVAVANISFLEMQELGLDINRSKGNVKSAVAKRLISVLGWEVAACGMEVRPQTIEYSLRSKNGEKYDVAKLARKFAIGGGHPAAAGLTITGVSIEDSCRILKEKMLEMWPELN